MNNFGTYNYTNDTIKLFHVKTRVCLLKEKKGEEDQNIITEAYTLTGIGYD